MTKLCPRGKAAAKRKFKVYPSAYANAYASKICAGKIKDPSGVKRKDFRGPKPMNKGGGVDAGQKQNVKDSIRAVESRKKSKKGYAGISKFNKGAMMTAGGESAMGRIQKAKMVKAKKGKFTNLPEPLLKGNTKANFKNMGKFPAVSAGGKGGGKGPRGMGKIADPKSFIERRMMLAGVKSALSSTEAARALRAAKATRIGKIAAGVAGVGLAAKAYLNKKLEESRAKKKVDKKKMGGLKAELNNPAKGYMAGGMADYYKDLM